MRMTEKRRDIKRELAVLEYGTDCDLERAACRRGERLNFGRQARFRLLSDRVAP